jgi:DNA repair protein RadC
MYQQITANLMQVKEPTSIKANTPSIVYEQCKDMGKLAQESFQIITLTAQNDIIDRHMITLGLLDASIVHPREVFRAAISDGAASIICMHNHPSGNPTPSAEDLRVTKKIVDAGDLLDIPVLDHVVIAKDSFLSIREEGLAKF